MYCITSPSLFSLLAFTVPSPDLKSQGCSNVYVSGSNTTAGQYRSPEWSVLSNIYVRLSPLGPEWEPYVVLAASQLHHLSRCSALSFVLQYSQCLAGFGRGGRLLCISPVHRVQLILAQMNKCYTHITHMHCVLVCMHLRMTAFRHFQLVLPERFLTGFQSAGHVLIPSFMAR